MRILKSITLAILIVAFTNMGSWGQPSVSRPGIPPGTTRADGSAHQDGDTLSWSAALGRWIAGAASSGTWASLTGDPIISLPYASLTAGQYIGDTSPGVCGETLVAGQAVYLGASGRYWKARSNASSTMPAVAVVAAVSGGGVAGQACVILRRGYINTGTYTAATAPVPIYVDRTTPGLITITAPSTVGDQVQLLGYVTGTANVLAININEALFEVGTGLVDLTTEVTGILPKVNGGTGSAGGDGTIADAATIYPSSNGTAGGTKVQFFTVTACAQATVFGTPAGSWANGDRLVIRIYSAAQQNLDFTTSTVYRFGDAAAPTTTVAGKTQYLGFVYHSTAAKWDCTGSIGNF